jgi:hypothetical protein
VGAGADDAGDLQRAVHRLSKASGEHQAEAGATFTTGVGAELIEWNEQTGEQLGGDPRALIGDMDVDDLVDGDIGGNSHGALRRRKTNGVGEKVEHHLSQTTAISEHRRWRSGAPNGYAPLVGKWLDQVESFGDHTVGVDIAQLDRHGPRLDACKVEDVVDDRQDVVRGEPNALERGATLIWRQVECLEVLREAGDRLQRRPQFVAQRGNELRLCEIGAFGALPGEVGLVTCRSFAGGVLVLDGERRDMCKSANELSVAIIRFVRCSVVDGKCAHDLRATADGARPAGTQVMVGRKLAKLLPSRVGGDVHCHHWFAEMHSGTTRAGQRARHQTVDCRRVRHWQRRRRPVA